MTKEEALKLALNVLINRVDSDHEVITAIREALALPVATNDTSQERVDETSKQRHEAQPEQEPVAWITKNGKGWLRWHRPEDNEKNKDSIPLYTTPPQRKPLTDEEIDKLPWEPHEGNPMTFAEGLRYFARAIEAAHGIKE